MLTLVVDDKESNRRLISRFVKSRGDDVILATSGREAVELVKEHDVDMVLMDINMPDMDGYIAAKKIKEIRSNHYLPIIFISALSEEDALEKALEAGGDDYVSKPVRFGILSSKIDAHTRIRELNSEVKKINNELKIHNIRLSREHELVHHFFDQVKENSFYDDTVIKTFTLPMSTFNGDTTLVGRRPNGGVTILLGDFTGHGLSAAVGTLPVSQIFYKMLEDNAYIGDIAKELNKQILLLLPVEMFFAASLIELSAKGDRLMIWHGGMPDAYLYDQTSDTIKTIKSEHLPLGVREQNKFDDAVQFFDVTDAQKLIVFTDGLTEAFDKNNIMINADVYKDAILNGESKIDSIVHQYKEYSNGVEQSDDVSIIELTCKPVKRLETEKEIIQIKETIPWQFKLHIKDEMLGRDVVQNIIEMIGSSSVLKEDKGVIYTLLMEMYTNALDHGVLGLDGKEKQSSDDFDRFYQDKDRLIKELSGAYIDVEVSYEPNINEPILKIEMSHNGSEFKVSENRQATQDALHGRGLELIDAISKEALYSDNGRCLSVTVVV